MAARILDGALFGHDTVVGAPLNAVFNVVIFVPSLAVRTRRLQDINRDGWWGLIILTVIGVVVFIYWACLKGTAGPNRSRPDRLDELSRRPRA